MTDNALSFVQVALDASDAARLAGFYAELFDTPIADGANEYFADIPAATGLPRMIFLQVPEARAGKNRVHLDFHAPDPAQYVQRVVALGGAHLGDFDEYGTRWSTVADPEGNVFDIGTSATD